MFYYDIFLSMSNKNHYKKLYLSKGKIILTFIALFFILELLFYFVIQFQEVGKFFPFGISFYIYTPILILLTIIFTYISVTKTYYELTNNAIIHHKMNTEIVYSYKNIVYIDEEYSLKHKQLRFFDNNGKEHYLVFDKNNIIYDEVIKKTKTLSKQDFHLRYPNAKL